MQRENNLDIVKGIAIWLMVLGHSNFTLEPFITIISSFHMPVFFLVSGYFFSKKGFKKQLCRDLKSLMQPYFLASIMAFSICWISPTIHPELYPGIKGMINIYKAAIIGLFLMDDTVKSYSFMPMGPLWFLVALFIARQFFSLVINVFYNKCLNIVLVICSFVFVSLFLISRNFNYFSLDSAFMAFPFLCIGFLLRKYDVLNFLPSRMSFFSLIVLFICFYYLSLRNGAVSMDGGIYGENLILFYLNAFIAFLLIFWIIKKYLHHFPILAYLGKNSLVVLIFHIYIIAFIKAVYVYVGGDVSSMPAYVSLGISFIVITMCIPICELVNRYFPYLLGRGKKCCQ